MKQRLFSLLLFALCLTAASDAAAQTAAAPAQPAGFRAEFMRQYVDAEKKLMALAEAVPPEKYSWRPAEGVRSMSEVFMHVAGGNYLLAGFAGAKTPEGVGRDLEKITEKAKVIESLKQSFEHVRQTALNTADADFEKATKMFGRDTTYRDAFISLAVHAHEHLGQAIAYARMNKIVPPWTAARETQQPRRPQ